MYLSITYVYGSDVAMSWVSGHEQTSHPARRPCRTNGEAAHRPSPTQKVPLSHVGFTRAAWQGRESKTIYQSEAVKHRLLPASLQVVGDSRKLRPASAGRRMDIN
jgi:hypothetical protein